MTLPADCQRLALSSSSLIREIHTHSYTIYTNPRSVKFTFKQSGGLAAVLNVVYETMDGKAIADEIMQKCPTTKVSIGKAAKTGTTVVAAAGNEDLTGLRLRSK